MDGRLAAVKDPAAASVFTGSKCAEQKDFDMLVLSRRKDQRVIVTVPGYPREIVITVIRTERNHSVIGFDAPREVAIRREELPLNWLRRAETDRPPNMETTT